MRYLRNLVMAGSALLPLAMAEPVFAQEPKTNVQEIGGITRTDIQRLLRELDDDRFIVRESASGELAEKTTQWIKSHGQNLLWKEWILPQEHYSLEVRKRLERILGIVAQEERKLLWLPSRIKTPKEWWNDESPIALSTVKTFLKEQTGTEIAVILPEGTPEPTFPRAIDGMSFWQMIEILRAKSGKHFDISQGQSGKITVYPPSLSTIERRYVSDGAVCAELWQSRLEEKKGHTTFGLLLRSEQKIPFGHWHIASVHARTNTGEEVSVSVSQQEGVRPDMPYFHIPNTDGARDFDLSVTFDMTGYASKTITIKDPAVQETHFTRLCAIRFDGIEERHNFFAIKGRLAPHILNATYGEETLFAGLRCLGYDDNHLITQKCGYGWDRENDVFSFEWLVNRKPKELVLEVPEYEVPHTVTLRFFDVPLRNK